MDVNEALDISKENIQPLKQGRNALQLGSALQAKTNIEVQQELLKQKDHFEIQLRSYEGDDPLQPWYDYIQWTEQSFPKHGREGNLQMILQRCLVKFKDEIKYAQDVRHVKLWLKYINMTTNPLEMYQHMYASEIGTECAIFYCNWADELEKNEDFTRADQVYIEGIKRYAQPIEDLLYAHNNFQVAVARRVLSAGVSSLPPDPAPTEQRSVFSTLRPHGRKHATAVNNLRIGSSIQRLKPGILRPLDNAAFEEDKKVQKPNETVKIYNDENLNIDYIGQHYELKPATKVPVREQITKENTKQPGRWYEAKLKQNVEQCPSSQPAFEVLEDKCDSLQSGCRPSNVIVNALKPRKLDEHISCPIAWFESPNPCRRPMYDKHKVYAGGTEFSFEELRAIKYNKRYEEEQKAKVYKDKCDGLQSGCSRSEIIVKAPKPRKLDEHISCEVALFEAPNPCQRPMYDKHKVYAVVGTEFSFEELRAIKYNERYEGEQKAKENKKKQSLEAKILLPDVGKERVQYVNSVPRSVGTCSFQLHEEVEVYKREIVVEKTFDTRLKKTQSSYMKLNVHSEHQDVQPFRCSPNEANLCENSSGLLFNPVFSVNTAHPINVYKTEESQPNEKFIFNNACSGSSEVLDNDLSTMLTDVEEPQLLHNDGSTQKIVTSSDSSSHTPSFALYVDNESYMDEVLKKAVAASKPENPRKPALGMLQQCTYTLTDTFQIGLKRPKKVHVVSELSMEKPNSASAINNSNAIDQSFTVNTKEAMNLMRDMWKTPEIMRQETDSVPAYQNIPKFTIHVDDSVLQRENCVAENVRIPSSNRISPFKVVHDKPSEPEIMKSAQVNVHTAESSKKQQNICSEGPYVNDLVPFVGNFENRNSEIKQTLPSNSLSFLKTVPAEESRKFASEVNCIQNGLPPVDARLENKGRIHILSEPETSKAIAPADELRAVSSKISSIPYVASPGMTMGELEELHGMDNKENGISSDLRNKGVHHRGFAGILQPSYHLPFVPLEDQEPGTSEVEEDLGVDFLDRCTMSNETCTTQAFKYPLPSSTPCVNQFRHIPSCCKDESGEEQYDCTMMMHKKPADIQKDDQVLTNPTQPQESLSLFRQKQCVQKSSVAGCLEQHHSYISNFDGAHEEDHSIANIHVPGGIVDESGKFPSIIKDGAQAQATSKTWEVVGLLRPLCTQPDIPQSYNGNSLSVIVETSKEYKSSTSSGSYNSTTPHTPSWWLGKTPGRETGNLEPISEISVSSEQQKYSCYMEHLDENLGEKEAPEKLSQTEGMVLKTIQKNLPKLELGDNLDPFTSSFTEKLLSVVGFPAPRHASHCIHIDTDLPHMRTTSRFKLGDDEYICKGVIGEGAYAKVMKATRVASGRLVALKVQKPACPWEYYILEELQIRLNDPEKALNFLSVEMAYFFNTGSVLVTEVAKCGTLISVVNYYKGKWNKNLPQSVVLYWTLEMLIIVEHLHKCNIIHGDIKPDNFIVQMLPHDICREPSLKLIDFGRSIDMTLVPAGTVFSGVDTTECFKTIEMRTNRPWTYQIDFFRLAGTVHCLLFGDYMKVMVQEDGKWFITSTIPRYYHKQLWRLFYLELLNINSCEELPNTRVLQSAMQEKLEVNANELANFPKNMEHK